MHSRPNAEGEFLEGPSVICEESSDTEEDVIPGTPGAQSRNGRKVTEQIPHTDLTNKSGEHIFLSPTEKTREFEMQPEVNKDHTIGNALGQQATQDATRFSDLDQETNIGLKVASIRPPTDWKNTIGGTTGDIEVGTPMNELKTRTALKSEAGQTRVTKARRLHLQEKSKESCRDGVAKIMRSRSTSKSLT